MSPENAQRLVNTLTKFGFDPPIEEFLKENNIVRMGVRPFRIELLSSIDGVSFDECYQRRQIAELDEVAADIIDLRDLRANKRASGRAKDLADLENLPAE